VAVEPKLLTKAVLDYNLCSRRHICLLVFVLGALASDALWFASPYDHAIVSSTDHDLLYVPVLDTNGTTKK
jgi:hypothetical protein